MKNEEFDKIYTNRVLDFERHIEELLPSEEGFCKTVLEAMNYSVRAGGKRIRPILLLEVNSLFGDSITKEAYCFAAALELIHTYSLVHDDLPAMDNDDLRRGKPTTHKKYGEAMGILAGDALLNYSMEVALLAFDTTDDYKKVADTLKLLYQKSGIYGMIGGQVADVEAEKNGESIDRKKLEYIYANKTGALLEAAMMAGCMLSQKGDADACRIMGEAASKIGLAFQIQDDILDIEGDEELIGKPKGSDERNEKATYVKFAGMETAKQDVAKLTGEAIDLLLQYTNKESFLIMLIESLVDRSS